MQTKKVILHFRLNGVPGRNQLNGIFRFLGRLGNWDLRLTQSEQELIAELEVARRGTSRPDGFIVSTPVSDEICRKIETVTTPTVLLDIRPHRISNRSHNLAFVLNDDAEIGRTAARHLIGLGNFRSFAFIHAKDTRPWSYLRGEAFLQELERHGRSCSILPPNDFDSEVDRARLTDFLRGLERPAAVFAAWDNRAIQVLEAAREARIVLPDEMAVLGVDDEILCEHTHPPLASIRPDNESEGYAAAETLDNMINGRKWHVSTLCAICGISERESASAIAPGGHLVRRALDFIYANRTRPLRVTDVVQHLGVSRRLADQRFRQFQSESILECITRIRLEEVKKRLTSSDASIATIAQACGFHDTSYLMTLFQRKVGMTMRAWRRQSRIPG